MINPVVTAVGEYIDAVVPPLKHRYHDNRVERIVNPKANANLVMSSLMSILPSGAMPVIGPGGDSVPAHPVACNFGYGSPGLAPLSCADITVSRSGGAARKQGDTGQPSASRFRILERRGPL